MWLRSRKPIAIPKRRSRAWKRHWPARRDLFPAKSCPDQKIEAGVALMMPWDAPMEEDEHATGEAAIPASAMICRRGTYC
jgi:hypothetical protein